VPWLADSGGWFFDCLEGAVAPVVADLLAPNGTCALAGFPIGQGGSNARRGLPVGHTLTRNGYSVVVPRREAPAGIWSPFAAFSWQLWLLFACSMPIVGVLLFVVDVLATRVDEANARRAAAAAAGAAAAAEADACAWALEDDLAGPGRSTDGLLRPQARHAGQAPRPLEEQQGRQQHKPGPLAWLMGTTPEDREASSERWEGSRAQARLLAASLLAAAARMVVLQADSSRCGPQ
jgi:hypothetical protein